MTQTLNTHITFSDEQAMLLEAATSFCRDQSPSSAVRARFGSETGFDQRHWQAMVDLGWLGIAVPEQHGGSGLGIAACAVVAEGLPALADLDAETCHLGLGPSRIKCGAVSGYMRQNTLQKCRLWRDSRWPVGITG
jgi:alkylation response protein AidB-like acyl-CoA dehydrogenase